MNVDELIKKIEVLALKPNALLVITVNENICESDVDELVNGFKQAKIAAMLVRAGIIDKMQVVRKDELR